MATFPPRMVVDIASLRRIARAGVSLAKHPREHAVYRSFASHTMVPRMSYVDNLALVAQVKRLQGCVVECGTWRGGMIAGVASVLGPERDYVIFDSFEGLPPAGEEDGPDAAAWQADTAGAWYYDNCTAERHFAEQAMAQAGVTSPEIVPGWFDATIAEWSKAGRSVAVLRLDGDWYDSTMVCLQHLFPLVEPGGLILIDDYGMWDGCNRAVHRYLADEERPEPIQRSGAGVAYILKR